MFARPTFTLRSYNVARFAARSFASEAQSIMGAKAPNTKPATPYLASAAALLATGAGLMAGMPQTKTKMEEDSSFTHQKRPKQKYASPEPNPIHGKESHHGDFNDPPPRPDLPTIPLEEVQEHNSLDDMWFTFRGAVYDFTFFKYGVSV